MRKFLLFIFLISSGYLSSDVNVSTLEKYHNPVFIESGTTSGNGLRYAWECKFNEIYIIDSNPILINYCKHLLNYFDESGWKPLPYSNWKPQINLFIGDSRHELRTIIQNIDKQITFFLHNYIPDPDGDTRMSNHILEELRQIKEHPIKTHAIIIDNVNFAGTSMFDDVSLDEIMKELKEINPNYNITLDKGGLFGLRENALLVAH